MTSDPWVVLAAGAESYAPYLQVSGELHDVVVGEPTQYGTAYHAYVNAALAVAGPVDRRAVHRDRAVRGLQAAIAHTGDPLVSANASSVARDTGGVSSRVNHRDFTWPPILKSYRLLRDAGVDVAAVEKAIAAVDIEASFRSRPPSNWSSVWLSGEWIRLQEGLSAYGPDDIDRWLGIYFDELVHLDLGLYEEPGKPNSYDLFTRFHFADMLAEGYDGALREPMERLMQTGLQRSLAVQLSDGSLASAHRSCGQTWTVGAQIAYFACAAGFFAGRDAALADHARAAAERAFASFERWQRPGATYSPVENLQPAVRRVGYEGYTADAHYGNLALAFLATGLLRGFAIEGRQLDGRPLTVRAEQAPTHRAIAHRGRISVHVNGSPAPAYDGFGITDLTFGTGRLLHFVSSVRHLKTGGFLNLGIGLRKTGGQDAVDVVAAREHTLTGPVEAADDALRLRSEVSGEDEFPYALDVSVLDDGVRVREATPGHVSYKTVLVPYLRDPGTGVQTSVVQMRDGVVLRYGDEEVTVVVDAPLVRVVDLPYDYENRRGLCGLMRLDLRDSTEEVRYVVTSRSTRSA